MMNYQRQRRQTYFQLSTQLLQMENSQIAALFDNDKAHHAGWGRHQSIAIGNSKLFVKRVPMTEIERDNFLSTYNLYNLPAYYHYGIGSAGHGVWREVVAHLKTTNWVLSDEIESFPLLYHYRIMPWSGERMAVDEA